jgi:alkanesulfonate monooxygenase SsuD/methylene tetrahydromethanopterin reductase-like flavin-dependent oxidoreductase (luciferase family)
MFNNEIKIGIKDIGCYEIDYEKIKNSIIKYDGLNYDSVWVMDHLYWGGGPLFECWTLLSSLATCTKRIRLGSLVLCNLFRYPSIVAKMSATLDVISGGRLEFGIGACWKKDECLSYGIPFSNYSMRVKQLEEAIIIIKKMWTERKANYKGKYYYIKEAICDPKPLQKPHPPIWVGGSGKKILRVVAKVADGCNLKGAIKECKHRLDILKKYCKKFNRECNKIKKSWRGDLIISDNRTLLKKKILDTKPKGLTYENYIKDNLIGTEEECIKKVQEFYKIGITYFIFSERTLGERELSFMNILREINI